MQTVAATFIAMTRAEAMAFVANKRFLDFGTILRVAEAEQDEVEVFFGVGKKLTETPGFNGSELSRLIALENQTIEISDVDGLQTALDGKAALVHSHEIADVNGLQDALDEKAASSDVTAALALKAPLESPTFTGTAALGVTPDIGAEDNELVTAEWVKSQISSGPIDAATLQGENGAFYLDNANHTGPLVIGDWEIGIDSNHMYFDYQGARRMFLHTDGRLYTYGTVIINEPFT